MTIIKQTFDGLSQDDILHDDELMGFYFENVEVARNTFHYNSESNIAATGDPAERLLRASGLYQNYFDI